MPNPAPSSKPSEGPQIGFKDYRKKQKKKQWELPVRAKKTPATLVSKVKNTFDKSAHTFKKVSLRESQKWVEGKKYVFAILEGIRS